MWLAGGAHSHQGSEVNVIDEHEIWQEGSGSKFEHLLHTLRKLKEEITGNIDGSSHQQRCLSMRRSGQIWKCTDHKQLQWKTLFNNLITFRINQLSMES